MPESLAHNNRISPGKPRREQGRLFVGATRSLLNAAKLLNKNETLSRLKELAKVNRHILGIIEVIKEF